MGALGAKGLRHNDVGREDNVHAQFGGFAQEINDSGNPVAFHKA